MHNHHQHLVVLEPVQGGCLAGPVQTDHHDVEILLRQGRQRVQERVGASLRLLRHPRHEVLDAVGQYRLLARRSATRNQTVVVSGTVRCLE